MALSQAWLWQDLFRKSFRMLQGDARRPSLQQEDPETVPGHALKVPFELELPPEGQAQGGGEYNAKKAKDVETEDQELIQQLAQRTRREEVPQRQLNESARVVEMLRSELAAVHGEWVTDLQKFQAKKDQLDQQVRLLDWARCRLVTENSALREKLERCEGDTARLQCAVAAAENSRAAAVVRRDAAEGLAASLRDELAAKSTQAAAECAALQSELAAARMSESKLTANVAALRSKVDNLRKAAKDSRVAEKAKDAAHEHALREVRLTAAATVAQQRSEFLELQFSRLLTVTLERQPVPVFLRDVRTAAASSVPHESEPPLSGGASSDNSKPPPDPDNHTVLFASERVTPPSATAVVVGAAAISGRSTPSSLVTDPACRTWS